MQQFAINNKKQRGFTLIEVMLAVFVVSITALIFAATFPTSQISHMKAAYMSYATSLAEQKVEEFKAAGYANIQLGSQEQAITIPPNGTQSITGTQTVNITQYATDIKKIEVTITWSGYRMVGGTVALVTLISDRS